MTWIKRNLFFVVGSLIALGLLGWAGFYNFSRWKRNSEWREKLNGQYEELRRLNNLKPHPGNSKVDNIAAAIQHKNSLTNFLVRVTQQFKPIPSIPLRDQLSSMTFAAALRETIAQLQRDAGNASVSLPPQYKFSFLIQNSTLNFSPGSLEPLSIQLGEVKAICDIFNAAKVNSLDGIRRERVSAEDQSTSAQMTDYLDVQSQTNEMAVITPYEVSFRCFSPELAQVMSGFASSPNGLVIKSLTIEPAPAVSAQEIAALTPFTSIYTPAPTPVPPRDGGLRSRSRYEDYRPVRQPPPVYVPAAAPAVARGGGLQTIIDERQLRVTMLVEVVKLHAKK